MGADDQNAEAGTTGAGSGKQPAGRRAFLAGAATGAAAMPGTMRAAVLDGPGPPSALAVRELPVPVPSAGWVLIRVRAFGLNRLELYLRLGLADAALELVGTPTLPDTLRSVRVHGVVCFTGMLSNQWTVPDFYPLDYLPTGVRLTAYKGDAADLPPRVLQDFLDAVAARKAAVPIGRVYRFDQIAEAHTDMEQNRASGKLVITT